MILKDKDGQLVDIMVSGTYVDDLEIDHAVYVNSGLDLSDEEAQELFDDNYEAIVQDFLESMAIQQEMRSEDENY